MSAAALLTPKGGFLNTMDKIKVLIADDLEAHRRRLERIINASDDLELAGAASNGYEAVMMAALHHPHIILMDIQMETHMAGIDAARQINEKMPDIRIIMLTVHKDDGIVFAAFQTGIVDYIIKTEPDEEIRKAIYSAYNDLSPIRPIIARKIRSEFQRMKQSEQSLLVVVKIISELTPSELAVLQLLGEGKNRREIARVRCVEQDTVKKQSNSILKKFSMNSSREVVRLLNDLNVYSMIQSL